jgi:hypothetical protein
MMERSVGPDRSMASMRARYALTRAADVVRPAARSSASCEIDLSSTSREFRGAVIAPVVHALRSAAKMNEDTIRRIKPLRRLPQV